jgi:hypothetical protein
LGLAVLLAAAAALVLSAGLRGAAQAAVLAASSYASGAFFFPPYPSGADRMGVAGAVALYTTTLQAGWYQDWGASPNPAQPGGMAYARTIYFTVNTNSCGTGKIPASVRGQVSESLTGTALINNLAAHPGALWIIGNEPDSIYNCSPIQPALYAELFHEFRSFIKAHDPSARVAIAGIVQPSPLRLAYLDQVLAHHQARFGQPLATDLWNIHLYAFPEIAGQAGAGVPPGATASSGWTHGWPETVSLTRLADNLRAMRQWLADRGERHKPLIITEFGQVIPDDGSYWLDGFQFTQAVSRDYLQGAVDHFLTATDPAIGYPADGNRLVQLWAWYSLRDVIYGGDLLNPDNSLTLAGQAFALRAGQHFMPYVDLYPRPVITPLIPPGSVGSVPVTLTIAVDNLGNAALVGPAPGRFTQHNAVTGQLLSTTPVSVTNILSRFAGAPPTVSTSWVLTPGTIYTLTFDLDPAQTLAYPRRSPQSLAYRVGYVPDLAVTALTSPAAPVLVWSAPVWQSFTAHVHNQGVLAAEAGTVLFELRAAGGQLVNQVQAASPALAPGAAGKTVAALLIPSPGPYTVTATILPAGLDLSALNDGQALGFLAAVQQIFFAVVQR